MSTKTAKVAGLLGETTAGFEDVFVAQANIAIEDFYTISAQRDSAKLIKVCKSACSHHETSVVVTRGMIIAVLTAGGVHGLFLVKSLTSVSADVDGYHMLMQ